jgi:hypothetical protein
VNHDEQQMLGAPYTFKWHGKPLRFGALDEGRIAELVALCKSNAIDEHDQLINLRYAGPLTPDQMQRREADEQRFEMRMSTGYYQWGERGMSAWRSTRAGARATVAVLLEAGGNPLAEADVTKLMMDGGEKLGRYIAAIVWDSEFPNVPRPAELTLAENLEIPEPAKSEA